MAITSLITISHFASGLQYDNEQKYPVINVTKFMSIAENSTEFKDNINGYAHYILGAIVITPKSNLQNTSSTTLEYNLVYDLYKSNDCPYAKVLVVTLNVHLKVINATGYSPYDIPTGYPLPGTCLPGVFPWKMKMDLDGLAGTIPWVPPLEQTRYGILAKNVSCINGQILMLKAEDNSPTCVKPDIAQKLIERGWAKEMTQTTIFDTGILSLSAKVTNTNFTVNYNIMDGKVSGMKLDLQSRALEISLQTSGNGTATIDLPRALIDSKVYKNTDGVFIVLEDGQEVLYKEIHKTIQDRVLSIPFKQGIEKIEIIGTTPI